MDTPTDNMRLYRDVSEPALGDEQYKLDRLFELRAVIDSLRTERSADSPRDGNDAAHHSPFR